MPSHWEWYASIIGIVLAFRLLRVAFRMNVKVDRPKIKLDHHQLPSGIPDMIQQLIDAGNQIGAIKELRKSTGMDLTQAKTIVSSWKKTNAAGVTTQTVEIYGGSNLPPDILDLIKDGKRIEAVRRLRQEQGMKTDDAREAVAKVTEAASNSADFNAPKPIQNER